MKTDGLVFLGLGSNLGNRRTVLDCAIADLSADPSCTVITTSSCYASDAIGVVPEPEFLNLVVSVLWESGPRDLLKLCQRIETQHGRTRPYPGAARTLDIDILFWDGYQNQERELTVPHQRLLERGFALLPLLEIAPDLMSPYTHTALSNHLNMDLLNQGIHTARAEVIVD